jgi:toxin ParE1/3/4
VGAPVHVIFYRAIEPGLVEIVRVLHERMEPGRQVVGDLG